MSDFPKFVVKMIIFSITFYFMLEYVEGCDDVDTHMGMAVVLSIVSIISIIFVVMRANRGSLDIMNVL